MFDLIKKSIEKHCVAYLSQYFILYPGKKQPVENRDNYIRLSVANLDRNEIKRESLVRDINILVDFQVFDKSDSNNVIFGMVSDVVNAFVVNPIYLYDDQETILTVLRTRSVGQQFVGFNGEYVQINITLNLFNYS
jgi:hypothetical protein